MATPLRVLLIEASEAGSVALLGQLRQGDYEPIWHRVDTAPGLEEALTQPWEIALCNPQLPGLGGPEALALLRAHGSDLPVIVVSNEAGEGAEAAAADADGFVSMAAPAVLLDVVERALRQAEARRVRERAEVALRESGERFGQAFEHAPIGMSIVGVDGILLHVNPAFCAMFGYSQAELMGMPVWRFTHPEDMTVTIDQLQRLIEGRTDAWHLDKRFFHRDGHIIWGRSTTWLVRGSDGVPRYVVSHLQDITEQRQMAEQMRRQQSELAHVLRVATMGEMVAQIAHEINQPLGAIANFANTLAHRVDDIDRMREGARHIAVEALRASEVIRRLRGFLRKGDSKWERCEVEGLVTDAVRLMEPEIREYRIALKLDLAPERRPIEVDRVQVVQVVLNLLRNSVEAIAAAGNGKRQLDVRTTADAHETVAVTIRDSGVGLPHAAETRVFDPFYTTKKGGLGLGLSISRSIIEAHQGRLWARSNSDQGATVGFYLPVCRT